MSDQPTVVLVHGAFSDASAWNGVSHRLQNMGYVTLAPAMPLRGLHSDAEYLASFLKTVEGPMVLAGHSYGGSVISHPVLANINISALVFIAAFAPDVGESAGELNGKFPGSKLDEATTIVREYPGGQDLYLRSESFRDVYAADLTASAAALLAASQRPIDVTALGETFDREPIWRLTPSWMVVSTFDDSLPAEAQRFMGKRAGSTIVEIDASHASPISRPEAVATEIHAASRDTSSQ